MTAGNSLDTCGDRRESVGEDTGLELLGKSREMRGPRFALESTHMKTLSLGLAFGIALQSLTMSASYANENQAQIDQMVEVKKLLVEYQEQEAEAEKYCSSDLLSTIKKYFRNSWNTVGPGVRVLYTGVFDTLPITGLVTLAIDAGTGQHQQLERRKEILANGDRDYGNVPAMTLSATTGAIYNYVFDGVQYGGTWVLNKWGVMNPPVDKNRRGTNFAGTKVAIQDFNYNFEKEKTGCTDALKRMSQIEIRLKQLQVQVPHAKGAPWLSAAEMKQSTDSDAKGSPYVDNRAARLTFEAAKK